jgi:hypothetical protein
MIVWEASRWTSEFDSYLPVYRCVVGMLASLRQRTRAVQCQSIPLSRSRTGESATSWSSAVASSAHFLLLFTILNHSLCRIVVVGSGFASSLKDAIQTALAKDSEKVYVIDTNCFVKQSMGLSWQRSVSRWAREYDQSS